MVTPQRLSIHIQGAVQGVGFRPFIWRLATELQLTGWVRNTSNGLFIEAEGSPQQLDRFLKAIPIEKPSISRIHSLKHHRLDPVGYAVFKIEQSDDQLDRTAWMLPDIATCEECLSELFDPADRRYLYPFTNCTHCGPRFTIIESLPYDRTNTTMRIFDMCPACRSEYSDPGNRRYHAQPNGCPTCGPHVELWDAAGHILTSLDAAIAKTAELICDGRIIAIKGLGGFHLVADATNDDAVRRLRQKKGRDEKPFALMADRSSVEKYCHLSPAEAALLNSPESPILLLQRVRKGEVAESVAPNNPLLGVMLPYTPLHHILLSMLPGPIVATSGNLADETICIDNREALARLGAIADYFLVHNRPIAHHVDDSIVRMMADRPVVLRRARGYAPLPISLKKTIEPAIAVGGHLKNSIAVAHAQQAFVSQHIGDLETESSITTLQRTVADFCSIYHIAPQRIIHDAHPDYASTRYASSLAGEKIAVQHHLAHIFSCMADNELEPPLLGVAWDGIGYGDDGTLWGGEFFLLEKRASRRFAHLRTFPLPGGDRAIRQPFRSAIGLLYEMDAHMVERHPSLAPLQQVSGAELKTIVKMLQQEINAPRTSSAGRLFDAVASLLDIQHVNAYEGQAAMQLEFSAWEAEMTADVYPYDIDFSAVTKNAVVDWRPMLRALLTDIPCVEKTTVAARFHNTLADIICTVAQKSGMHRLVLSGGTFQNKYLVEKTTDKLTAEGFRVYTHQQVPPNDGGIALGQITASYYKDLNRLCV
ncbi:carbamoyltransferase HypF [candidate division KSB1 bacterium]|nr:MAG: carbamoyltransferase HypF [candidate division KSB1 bacterium]